MCVSFATSPSVSSAQGHLVAVHAAALMTKSLFSRLHERLRNISGRSIFLFEILTSTFQVNVNVFSGILINFNSF